GIFGFIGERVVFAVHRHPFARTQAGAQPDRRAKCGGQTAIHRHRAMRKGAVEVHTRRKIGGLSDCETREKTNDDREQHGGTYPNYENGRGAVGNSASGKSSRGAVGTLAALWGLTSVTPGPIGRSL